MCTVTSLLRKYKFIISKSIDNMFDVTRDRNAQWRPYVIAGRDRERRTEARMDQHTLLIAITPPVLRRALIDSGTSSVEMVQQIMRRALERQEQLLMDELAAPSMEDVAAIVSSIFIDALTPLAQRLMVSMKPAQRAEVMAWLSDPELIAQDVLEQIEMVLGQEEAIQRAMESLSEWMPEVAAQLEDDAGHLPTASHIVSELQSLRNGDRNISRRPSAEEVRKAEQQRQRSIAIAADAAETARRSAAKAPRAAEVRSSRRLASRMCPLAILNDDCLRLVISDLEPQQHATLLVLSKRWRQHVQQVHATMAWREQFGCIDTSMLLKVCTQMGKARLDIGEAGCHPCQPCLAEVTNAPLTRLMVRRLDGPSIGFVSQHHVIGIFDETGRYRVDLAIGTHNPQVRGLVPSTQP